MRARDDERWKQAQADYVAEYEGLDPDVAFMKRCAAALRMYEIEREHKSALGPASEVLDRIASRDTAG